MSLERADTSEISEYISTRINGVTSSKIEYLCFYHHETLTYFTLMILSSNQHLMCSYNMSYWLKWQIGKFYWLLAFPCM